MKKIKNKVNEFVSIAFRQRENPTITLIDECSGEEFTPDVISYDRYPNGDVNVKIRFNGVRGATRCYK